MLIEYATGVGVLLAVLVAWAAIQRAWRRSFPDAGGDPDALAGRRGCSGLGCDTSCEPRRCAHAASEEEMP